jgi:hypothetical protein
MRMAGASERIVNRINMRRAETVSLGFDPALGIEILMDGIPIELEPAAKAIGLTKSPAKSSIGKTLLIP